VREQRDLDAVVELELGQHARDVRLDGRDAHVELELFGMRGALALGLVLMHSAAAIVTYFVLPTVVGIVVEVVSSLHGPAAWFEPNRSTSPLAEGLASHVLAYFAVFFVLVRRFALPRDLT
jgi:hypothetical protein